MDIDIHTTLWIMIFAIICLSLASAQIGYDIGYSAGLQQAANTIIQSVYNQSAHCNYVSGMYYILTSNNERVLLPIYNCT